jgi:hypothetical protein
MKLEEENFKINKIKNFNELPLFLKKIEIINIQKKEIKLLSKSVNHNDSEILIDYCYKSIIRIL